MHIESQLLTAKVLFLILVFLGAEAMIISAWGYAGIFTLAHLLNLPLRPPKLSDHPDDNHSKVGRQATGLQSEACPSAVALNLDNLILNRLEKGSNKYEKTCQAELSHFV